VINIQNEYQLNEHLQQNPKHAIINDNDNNK